MARLSRGDAGGDEECAGEPGGQGVVVGSRELLPVGADRVPGPGGNCGGAGGLGVNAVGDHCPRDGAEHGQAGGAADLLAGAEQV